MNLSEMQKIIREIYIHHDSRRGVQKTLEWFLSEVNELKAAIQNRDIPNIKEEAADTLAWLLSLLNLLNIDIEEAFLEKYNNKCPRCGSKPCKCIYREGPT